MALDKNSGFLGKSKNWGKLTSVERNDDLTKFIDFVNNAKALVLNHTIFSDITFLGKMIG